jgi:hypothetical protein
MTFGPSNLAAAVFGAASFSLAGVQSATANPIYHLGPGAEYSAGSGVGTFAIPSVAQGIVFYLDANDPPPEITLTGLFNTSGEKVRCLAVTRFEFACSAEAALHAHQGDGDERDPDLRANGRGTLGDGSNGNGPNGDPVTHSANGSAQFQFAGDGNDALLQIANFVNDPPAGPASIPEPASLALFASALAGLGLFGRRRRKN